MTEEKDKPEDDLQKTLNKFRERAQVADHCLVRANELLESLTKICEGYRDLNLKLHRELELRSVRCAHCRGILVAVELPRPVMRCSCGVYYSLVQIDLREGV